MANVETEGRPATRMTLRNVSRGGAVLASDWAMPTGTLVEVELPDAGGAVPARVVRCGNGELGVVFGSEPQALQRIDRFLARMTRRAA